MEHVCPNSTLSVSSLWPASSVFFLLLNRIPMWLSTVGLNNVLKGILVVSSLGLFTNTAAGSRPAQLFVQTCIFFPALSSFFFSPPASSFLCPCHPFPLLFPFLLIFFFSLSVVKLNNFEDCSTFKLTDFMHCSDVEFPVSLVFWLLYFSVPNFSFASLPYFLKLSIFSLISILFIIASWRIFMIAASKSL